MPRSDNTYRNPSYWYPSTQQQKWENYWRNAYGRSWKPPSCSPYCDPWQYGSGWFGGKGSSPAGGPVGSRIPYLKLARRR